MRRALPTVAELLPEAIERGQILLEQLGREGAIAEALRRNVSTMGREARVWLAVWRWLHKQSEGK